MFHLGAVMLNDKTVLVTNVMHFVGRATVRAALDHGAKVYCHDETFSETKAREDFASEFQGTTPVDAVDPEGAVQGCVDLAGGLDALVSNDFFPAERAPIEEVDPERLKAAFEALTVVPTRFATAAVPHLKQAPHGRLVFVTSAAPLRGLPNYSMYATVRGAANALAVSLASELARSGVTVNAVAPNFIESPSYFPEELISNPEAMAKIASKVPMRRLGQPNEVAELIALLCSESGGFLTGQVIPVAGGWA